MVNSAISREFSVACGGFSESLVLLLGLSRAFPAATLLSISPELLLMNPGRQNTGVPILAKKKPSTVCREKKRNSKAALSEPPSGVSFVAKGAGRRL